MFSKSSKLDTHEELQRAKQELALSRRRAQLLEQRLRNNQQVFVDFESIAKAIGHLIVSKDSERAVRDTLSLIGEGSALDRIYILKNTQGGHQGAVINQVHTWVNKTGNVQAPDFQSLPYEVFFPTWIARLKNGEHLFGSLDQAPDIEHLTLAKQGVVSFLWIPLFFDDEWWGVMGFDQVAHDRVWHPKEISGYVLLATSIMEFMRRQDLEENLRVFQERYDMASRAGQVGVWDWDIENNRVFLDPSIRSMAGYRGQELGDDLESWEKVFVLDQDVKWVEELNRRILNHEKDFELEHWIRHSNGQLLGAFSRGKAVYDKTGKAIRILGTTTDITHLKAIQNDLRSARDLAEEGSRSKSEFMAKMSHEIRTPLNGVMGFATLLKHTELDSEQEDYLTNLETSSKLLLSMVNNILDFSKIEAGKLDLEQKPFDIQGSIETILQVFGDSVVKKGLKMEFVPGEGLPSCVITDPLRIQQVVLNLIGNAVKFTEQGSIQISAAWKDEKDGKGRLRLAVKDSGIGIEPSRLKAIFEPFTQADSSMTRRFGGSGLGLTICQNILQAMGSRLEVTSTVGEGSEFSFEILVEETAPEIVQDNESVRETITQSSSSRAAETILEQRAKVKILLAEDNALNQQVISKLLNRLGYNAVLVEDGQEAVDALNRWDFDFVFMDLMMPNLDGISATQVIRETLPPAKQPVIVALTANTSEEDINNCMSVGMNDFLSKPVELETLERTLNEHLDSTDFESDREPEEAVSNPIEFDKIQDKADEQVDQSFEHFDPDYMRNLMGSDSEPEIQDEFSIDAIEIFLETTDELVESFETYSREEKWKDFERSAHSLKGTAKTVGALILGNLALQLELWVKDGHSGSRKAEIRQVAEEYQALAKELTRYRSSLEEKKRRIS
ncbi:MAG: ATP-binding protein [Verrucomicrobia bacterium]|nr:ATP-binding protein [Verrucomicrobiota bacterium]